MLGRPVVRHSPARLGKAGAVVERMMREVHDNIPSTVQRADLTGAKKEAMLRAVAFSKARAAGVKV